jgi:hypothetical protein
MIFIPFLIYEVNSENSENSEKICLTVLVTGLRLPLRTQDVVIPDFARSG